MSRGPTFQSLLDHHLNYSRMQAAPSSNRKRPFVEVFALMLRDQGPFAEDAIGDEHGPLISKVNMDMYTQLLNTFSPRPGPTTVHDVELHVEFIERVVPASLKMAWARVSPTHIEAFRVIDVFFNLMDAMVDMNDDDMNFPPEEGEEEEPLEEAEEEEPIGDEDDDDGMGGDRAGDGDDTEDDQWILSIME